ncbi:MAG: hypothetical protein JWQ18_594 [Conexibacter sp.]|nr:hypothetical protein [Conexibacter sp.]
MTATQIEVRDRLEIQDLYAAVVGFLDAGAADAFVACFTEDATFSSTSGLHLTGHEDLRRFATEFHERARRRDVRPRHLVASVLLEQAGPDVVGSCLSFLVETPRGGQPALAIAASYSDRLRRDPDAWRFASRVVARDGEADR